MFNALCISTEAKWSAHERVAKRTSSNAHNINHHEQNTKLNKMTFWLKDLENKT